MYLIFWLVSLDKIVTGKINGVTLVCHSMFKVFSQEVVQFEFLVVQRLMRMNKLVLLHFSPMYLLTGPMIAAVGWLFSLKC